jgi:hypothetical protein
MELIGPFKNAEVFLCLHAGSVSDHDFAQNAGALAMLFEHA